jgi:hypothetical protein
MFSSTTRVAVQVDDQAASFSGTGRTDFAADDGAVVASSSSGVQVEVPA